MTETSDRTVSRRTEPGSAPGELRVDPEARDTRLSGFRFASDQVEVLAQDVLHAPATLRQDDTTLWLNVNGLGDADDLRAIADAFQLHPLAVEDVLMLDQRAKAEDYPEHLFCIMRMPEMAETGRFKSEQVSIFLGDNFVITLQERPGDVFGPVRARLHNPLRPIRARGAGYLAYALIDAVIDAYFPVLEKLGQRLEALEDDVVERPKPEQISEIHAIKRDLMAARAALWPIRDMVASLLRDQSPRFDAAATPYLRDCHDHTFLLIDMIETHRETASGLVDIHLSSQSNRMNEVMQVLTLVSTIFIPLTFIAGVYGMNFNPNSGPWSMPELGWAWGYPVVMGAMGVIALVLALWFRSLGWLGSKKR